MLAPIGTQVQLRCSVVQEYGVRWTVIPTVGVPISTSESDSVISLGSLGIMVVPTSIVEQDSELTFNGTQSNSGTTVVCIAALLTDTSMRCTSEDAIVVFYGMNKLEAI